MTPSSLMRGAKERRDDAILERTTKRSLLLKKLEGTKPWVACSASRDYRVTAHIVEAWWLKPAHLKNTYKIYLSVRPWSKFLYQQIALDVLFQIRYKGRYLYDVRTEGGGGLPNT